MTVWSRPLRYLFPKHWPTYSHISCPFWVRAKASLDTMLTIRACYLATDSPGRFSSSSMDSKEEDLFSGFRFVRLVFLKYPRANHGPLDDVLIGTFLCVLI
jgi:hypothetical protein